MGRERTRRRGEHRRYIAAVSPRPGAAADGGLIVSPNRIVYIRDGKFVGCRVPTRRAREVIAREQA
jgi:hypothetical protein